MKFTENKNGGIKENYAENKNLSHNSYRGNKKWDTLESDAARIDRTGKFERTYKNKDGSFTALFENVPSQYKSSDGRFDKIDNSLVSEESEEGVVFRNKANAFTARFPEKMSDKTFSIERGIYKACFSVVDSHNDTIPAKMRSSLKGCYKNNPGKFAAIDDSDKSKIVYTSFCKGGDLEYSVFNDRVKENIIVHEKRAQYKFAFIMNLENLVPDLNDDGSISLFSADDETAAESEVIFSIPAPVMFDGDGNSSELVKYDIKTISEEENKYLFVAIADSEWINAEDRSFPVTIDPQVVLNQTENNTALINVCRCLCDCCGNNSPIYTSGSYELSDNSVEKRYIQVEIKNPTKYSRAFDKNVRAMRASLIWDISSGSGCNGHFVIKSGERVIEHFVYDGQHDIRVDVTNFLNEMIKDGSDSFTLTFEVSADCDCTHALYLSNAASALRMLVDYIPEYLAEQNGEDIGFDAKRAGAGKVNLNTGNIVFEHSDVASDSAVMPISVNHIFNGHNRGKEMATLDFTNSTVDIPQNYRMGDGWKLNLHQNLVVPERGDTPDIDDKIHYINAAGKHIVFEKKYYYVEDGVKHFVSEDVLPDEKESDGTYKKEIDGKEHTIIEAFMSDNGLTVHIDINKTMYFNENNYQKYYVLNNIKYPITPNQYNSFTYDMKRIYKSGYGYYEVNPIYIKYANNEEIVTLNYCGRKVDYTVDTTKTTKRIYKDSVGEYFLVYHPKTINCYNQLASTAQKIYIFTEYNNSTAVSISTESLSDDLKRIDAEIEELDNCLVDLTSTKQEYEAQLESYNGTAFAETLKSMQEEYNRKSLELNYYQSEKNASNNIARKNANEQAISANRTKLKEVIAERDRLMNENPELRMMYYNQYAGTISDLNYSITSLTLTNDEISVAQNIAKKQSELTSLSEKINEYNKININDEEEEIKAKIKALIPNINDNISLVQAMKSEKEKERDTIVEAEQKLPCDYIYDESGNMLTFDYHGRLIGVCDCYNNSISISYNNDKQIIEVTTSDKQTIGFAYNSDGRLEKITDVFGRVTHYEYDGSKLVKIVYPENDTRSDHGVPATSFTYDDEGNLLTITDQSGYIVKLEYEANKITVSDATVTAEINNSEIIAAETEKTGDMQTVIELVSPMCTSVTDDSGKAMYQFDNTGRVLAKYKVSEESVSDGKLVVENGTTFAYTEKKRSYSAQSDETKKNYITDAGFESIETWERTDGVSVADTHYTEGVKSLMIIGDPDADRRVYKTVTVLPADRLHYQLSLWAKAESAQIQTERNTGYEDQYLETHANTELFDENAPRKFGIKAVATYADGIDEFYASFDWYNTDWQLCQLPIRLKSEATSIEVSFEYGYNLGTAYIDNFRLTAEYGTEKEFSDDGKLLLESDGKIVRCYGYDGSKNPSKVVEVEYEKWLLNPEVSHFVTADAKELADKGCRVTRYYYNSKNSVIMVENPDGIVTEYEYNENGLQTKSYQYHKNDPSSKRYTENTRDEHGRETEVMDARGEVKGETLSQKYTYEWGNSLVKSMESAGGIKTHYGYSHVDDTLIGVTTDDNGIEHTNRMSYTANLLTGLDNMSGICYNYKYDGFGRMTEAIINGTRHATFDYCKKSVDGKTCDKEVMTLASGDTFTTLNEVDGDYFEIKYEDASKVETVIKKFNEFNKTERYKQYTEFPNQSNAKIHTLHYDENGNLEKHVFGNYSAEYEYDKYNRLKNTNYCFSTSDKHAYTYKYKDGLKNELEEVNGFGLVQTFAHDKLGRQTESKISDSCCTSIYSKKASYLKYGDHSTDIIADLTYKIANGNTDREKYSYDKEGNISAIHENGRLKVKYTYDALNRLIREDNKELDLTTTFEYDNGGNIIRQNEYAYSLADTDQLTDGTEIVYTYDGDRSDKLTDFNGEAITYDANGCPLTYRDIDCTFTRGTMLATYGSNTFDYDADGIRTKKNGITFTYVDGKLIRQTGGSGTIDFIYGAGGAIGFKFNNTTYIYRRNLMGDVTHIYTTDGTPVAHYVYDAWGNHKIYDVNGNEVTKSMSAHIGNINPIRYRGYYYDDYENENGLYYLEARYYDPDTGRFISQDEIDFILPNHLTGLNLYAYCNNNPVMYSDPSGCLVFTTALLIAIGIGAGIGALTGAAVNGATYAMEHAGTDSFSWQGFGAAVAGGAVSGLITGAVSGAASIIGGPAGGVLAAYTAAGFAGEFAGSIVKSAISGEYSSVGEMIGNAFVDGAWGAAGGALGGLMEGAITPVRMIAEKAGKPLSKVLTKVIRKTVTEIGPSLLGGAISDFTNWYARFATENTVSSYRRLA